MPDTVAHFAPLTGTPLAVSREFDRTVLDQVRANLLARGYVQVTNPHTTSRTSWCSSVRRPRRRTTRTRRIRGTRTTATTVGGDGTRRASRPTGPLVYPFYASVGVMTFDRGTFLVTIVPTLTVNPLAK